MALVLTAEPALCTGCGMCELLCSGVRMGRASPHLSRIRVVPRGDGFGVAYCRHCRPAPCRTACPVPEEAMAADSATGALAIVPEKCLRCLACVDACPFAAIQVSPAGEILKCDLCQGAPLCARFCPPRVLYSPSQPYPWPQRACLSYVEPHQVASLKRQALRQKP